MCSNMRDAFWVRLSGRTFLFRENSMKKILIKCKKIIVIILCFLFCFCCACTNQYDIYNETNEIKTEQFSGDGSAHNPYIIESFSNILFLEQSVNTSKIDYYGKFFIQTNDIDMENYEWTPVGKNEKLSFRGNYNGNGYKIKNIKITQAQYNYSGKYAGLFGCCKENEITNVCLENIIININVGHVISHVGLLVGYGDQCNITNCKSAGDIAILSDKAQASLGGIIGTAFFSYPMSHHPVITNCESNITISSNSAVPNIGGIAGRTTNYDVGNCSSNNTIYYNGTMAYVGGMMGGCHNGIGGIMGVNLGGVINKCESNIDGHFKYDAKAGGIIGCSDDGVVKNCSAIGTVRKVKSNEEPEWVNLIAFDYNSQVPEDCICEINVIFE